MATTQRSDDPFDTLKAIVDIGETNPFGWERPEKESRFLGSNPSTEPLHLGSYSTRAEATRNVVSVLEEVLNRIAPSVLGGKKRLSNDRKKIYRSGVWFWIYHQHLEDFDRLRMKLVRHPEKEPKVSRETFERFRENLERFLRLSESDSDSDPLVATERDLTDLFAFCFQLRRGLHGILNRIVGTSSAVVRLRCSIWEAIFTRRLIWSFQYLKDRMSHFSTLILGPSGTGKDLVAEIVGTSQFIPFDPATMRFTITPDRAYRAVNLSALTPTLIESELFGHVKGAFTGASSSRRGHLELCSPHGVLFLDEIGDLSPEIQVKLLRVLQSRDFYPLGSDRLVRFEGRILSATNRDLREILASGQMRKDFLYRIAATIVRVPTLEERFEENPAEADLLIDHLLERILGLREEEVYREIRDRIRELIETGYPWPGNVRELEQCIRSLLVRSEFQPLLQSGEPTTELDALLQKMRSGRATLHEVLSLYCRSVFDRVGSYQEAAKRLGVDWRTVKKHLSSS